MREHELQLGDTIVRTLDLSDVRVLADRGMLPYGTCKSDRETLLRIAAAVGIEPEAAERAMRRVERRRSRTRIRT